DEMRIEGHELENLLSGMAIEDADIRPAGRSRHSNDVRDAGVVDIPQGDSNASVEVRAIGHEIELCLARCGIKELDFGPAPGIRTRDPVVGRDQSLLAHGLQDRVIYITDGQ